MNSVIAGFPGRRLHVILDNLNTHKKNEHWLKAHSNVQFHFTSFTSLKQLQEHIDAYVNAYDDKAAPFVWTKKKVRQRRFKGRRITQL
jgi:hypothetical protein